MATTLRTPTRQTARVPAARGVAPAVRTTPDPRPGALARTGRIAAGTARGIGIFAVTTAKVVLLGKHGID
ncbi:hypothetical protein [Streptodolium elevatio]|uniref:Uncharacterized protein n=1 Tax=Streptodolium elevatio TaxID=3157996 RepID=A0ABV3DGS6_9ACTN